MTAEDLADWFPDLSIEGYEKTSEDVSLYNCSAWAMGENHTWWEPYDPWKFDPHDEPRYWPPEAPNEFSIEAYIIAFGTRGYVECDSEEWDPGYQKIAIYLGYDYEPSHVALLIEPGKWSSKIGEWEDITHYSLTVLEGDKYGEVFTIMRRPWHVKHVQPQDAGRSGAASSTGGPSAES